MIMFDDVIDISLEILAKYINLDQHDVYLVRDTSGTLVAIVPDNAVPSEIIDKVDAELDHAVAPYNAGFRRGLLRYSDVLDLSDVVDAPERTRVSNYKRVWLVDRLLTNQDWLRPTLPRKHAIQTVVGFSVKGGVGRSTALAMLAWHFAREGRNVLLVDLDLEAPGVGTMLLSDQPKYGLADWLVESINGRADSGLLQDCVMRAPIAAEEVGELLVLPAYGSHTKNYISKVGRIYSPGIQNGEIEGFAERLRDLLDSANQLHPKLDIILLDARAGLHDIGSAAVTRLGAEALLFARNDEQNWWAYRQLFNHLKHSSAVSKGMGDEGDLRWRLKMVAAQTNPTEDARRSWMAASYEEWIAFYDDEASAGIENFQPVVFDQNDSEAPHWPLFINFDAGVRGLALNNADNRPDWNFVQGIFADFFRGMDQRMPNAEED